MIKCFYDSFVVISLLAITASLSAQVNFRDEFDHLKFWHHELIRDIPQASKFRIVDVEGGKAVEVTSEKSASFLRFKESFNPYRDSKLSWRWKVLNIVPSGDANKKSGDDFAVRIAITFKYDPAEADFYKRMKYSAYKAWHGEYPHDSALHYVWANRAQGVTSMKNAHDDSIMMIFLQSGSSKLGQWLSEEVNVLEDYKKYFGKQAPEIAEILIMSDTDNTGESASAQVDWLELSK